MNTEKRNTAAPAEEEFENIKIGTIVKIMRKFNISYGQYIKTRAYWQQKYTESGGVIY